MLHALDFVHFITGAVIEASCSLVNRFSNTVGGIGKVPLFCRLYCSDLGGVGNTQTDWSIACSNDSSEGGVI